MIVILRAIQQKGVAEIDDIVKATRQYGGYGRETLYIYLGRFRARGLVLSSHRPRDGRGSAFAQYQLTLKGHQVLGAWNLLRSVSPSSWPLGKPRPRRRSQRAQPGHQPR